MNRTSIGFLGGCLNNQKGIEKEEFYYEVFSRHLADIPHKVATSIYISFDTLLNKADGFIDKNELDVLFLVIRQFPLMPLHKPLIKFENKNGEVNWSLHPALFDRKLSWNPNLSAYHALHEYAHKDKAKFGLRDLNLLAGVALGLYSWAPQYVLQEVKKVRDLCKEKNIEFNVLSTQRYPTSVMGDIACKRISRIQEKQFRDNEINYVNIIHLGPEYFASDQVHFNAECHKLIADMLLTEFRKHYPVNEIDRRKPINFSQNELKNALEI